MPARAERTGHGRTCRPSAASLISAAANCMMSLHFSLHGILNCQTYYKHASNKVEWTFHIYELYIYIYTSFGMCFCPGIKLEGQNDKTIQQSWNIYPTSILKKKHMEFLTLETIYQLMHMHRKIYKNTLEFWIQCLHGHTSMRASSLYVRDLAQLDWEIPKEDVGKCSCIKSLVEWRRWNKSFVIYQITVSFCFDTIPGPTSHVFSLRIGHDSSI